MRTQRELEAALLALGWTLDAARQTSSGWKATIRRGADSLLATGPMVEQALEELLLHARARAKRATGKLASEEAALRHFCARILGWSDEHAMDVENALRSIHLSTTHRAALVLLGDADPCRSPRRCIAEPWAPSVRSSSAIDAARTCTRRLVRQ